MAHLLLGTQVTTHELTVQPQASTQRVTHSQEATHQANPWTTPDPCATKQAHNPCMGPPHIQMQTVPASTVLPHKGLNKDRVNSADTSHEPSCMLSS